ncbi:hypothetical protein [Massilia genomosp. 1]|uniref:Uncharacterized protein n=1 Tax=Massilia genomosp. 1 TaxID=2609280 RepID=A0ABX0MQ72_9BURK|nr:hypothetical protein [Massilia genomosp. 1]NHZ62638.1 hypothetical protein [Massilia genomosp. 1]
MSELTKRSGQLAAVGAINAVNLTPDERLMLATYRAPNIELQGFCLDVTVSMKEASSPRHVRPTLKVITGGAT